MDADPSPHLIVSCPKNAGWICDSLENAPFMLRSTGGGGVSIVMDVVYNDHRLQYPK